MISTVVVRMDSSCMVVGRYTKCLAGFSMGPLLPPGYTTAAAHHTWVSHWPWRNVHSMLVLHVVLIPCSSCCRTQDPGLRLLCWACCLAAAAPQLPCLHACTCAACWVLARPLTHLWHAVLCQVACAVPAPAHALRQVAFAAAAWQGHGVLVGWGCGAAVLVLPLQRLQAHHRAGQEGHASGNCPSSTFLPAGALSASLPVHARTAAALMPAHP